MRERLTFSVIKTIMPCVEGDRSDCQPPKTTIALSRNRVCLLIYHPQHRVLVSYYRHRPHAADLPAKVAKRIGCAHIRGCSFKIGWSRIFGGILVINSSSIFMSPFHARQRILPEPRRGHVISLCKFLQTPRVDFIAIGLRRNKQANCNESGSKYGLQRCTFYFAVGKERVK